MKQLVTSSRGETLIEVMCALILVTIALGTLLGAVRFSSSAQHRQQIQLQAVSQLRQSLRQAPVEEGEAACLVFVDPMQEGDTSIAFAVDVYQVSKEGTYTDASGNTQRISFSLFSFAEGGNG